MALVVVVIVLLVVGVVIYLATQNNTELEENNPSPNPSQTENPTSTATPDENDQTIGSNILVLYFSMSGNTEAVANEIHSQVGGDIIRLQTVQTYPDDYDELVDYAQEEQRQDARPELSTVITNIDQYDTIFLGYPNWWGDMPMPIYTFLDNYDLSGKTIAPFMTHGGSGLSGTPATIRREEPHATVTEGLAIRSNQARNSQDAVTTWLANLNF